ncbi:hypothetical protein ACIGO9_30745 [Nocardia asteroides]|uniref:hypothetical protein n=1 Tax=Nocardia asteroides TaxID=1824 RepID=UPI0037CC82D1
MADDWFTDETPAAEAATSEPSAPLALVPTTERAETDDWFTTSGPTLTETAAPQPIRRVGRREPVPTPSQRPLWPLIAAIGAAGAIMVGGGVIAVSSMTPDAAPQPPTPVAATTTPAADPKLWCSAMAPGEVATVTSPDPGTATIAGFDAAYYERRDAALARAWVAPDARVGSVEELGAGIATVPTGTSHCVITAKQAPGLYNVDVFTRAPHGGALQRYRQTITTVDSTSSPKGALITSIIAREGK